MMEKKVVLTTDWCKGNYEGHYTNSMLCRWLLQDNNDGYSFRAVYEEAMADDEDEDLMRHRYSRIKDLYLVQDNLGRIFVAGKPAKEQLGEGYQVLKADKLATRAIMAYFQWLYDWEEGNIQHYYDALERIKVGQAILRA